MGGRGGWEGEEGGRREGGTGSVHNMSHCVPDQGAISWGSNKCPRCRVGPTCTGLGLAKGARASMVTTHGEIVVPRFLPRKGPRGTYSHFCGGKGDGEWKHTMARQLDQPHSPLQQRATTYSQEQL